MPTSTCFFIVVWRLAMSTSAIEMPFQQDEEHSRKKGSTHSSLELAPSPFGPTMRSGERMTLSSSSVPDWLPRKPRPSHIAGSALTSLLKASQQVRSEKLPAKSGLVVCRMYQSAKPPEVVQEAFLRTRYPPSTFSAPEEI